MSVKQNRGSMPFQRSKVHFSPILLFTALLAQPLAFSAVSGHGRQAHITQIYVYPDYGGGDVIAVLDDPIAGCEAGIWLSPSSPGFKSAFATLLMLQNNGGAARVWVHDDQIWSGSSARHCKLYTINPIR